VASLSQGRTAAAQCGLFTHKSVPVIFEPPCNIILAERTGYLEVIWIKIKDVTKVRRIFTNKGLYYLYCHQVK